MSLKTWWQKRREILAREDVEYFLDEYLNEYTQPYDRYRKEIARRYFPRKGKDLLAQKESFIRAYSIREKEFRDDYMSWGNNDCKPLACRYSDIVVQTARFEAHKKWAEMMRIRSR